MVKLQRTGVDINEELEKSVYFKEHSSVELQLSHFKTEMDNYHGTLLNLQL